MENLLHHFILPNYLINKVKDMNRKNKYKKIYDGYLSHMSGDIYKTL